MEMMFIHVDVLPLAIQCILTFALSEVSSWHYIILWLNGWILRLKDGWDCSFCFLFSLVVWSLLAPVPDKLVPCPYVFWIWFCWPLCSNTMLMVITRLNICYILPLSWANWCSFDLDFTIWITLWLTVQTEERSQNMVWCSHRYTDDHGHSVEMELKLCMCKSGLLF